MLIINYSRQTFRLNGGSIKRGETQEAILPFLTHSRAAINDRKN
jgi:hypothetical protein